MSTEYRISETDYIRAMQLHARPSRMRIIAFVVLVIVLLALAIHGEPVVRAVAIAGIVAGMVGWLISLLLVPMLARRHYLHRKLGDEPLSIELMPQGLHFSSRQGNGVLPWEGIQRWRQNDGYVLLYPRPRMFHIVPRALDAQGFDTDHLIAQLTAKVGKPS